MLGEEVDFIRSVISPAVRRHHPSKANHERMSLYDLIAFAILAHRHFEGVYKRAYRALIDDLGLFPAVRYNKVVERLHRYEGLLLDCLGLFGLEGLRVAAPSLWRRKRWLGMEGTGRGVNRRWQGGGLWASTR